MSILEQVAGIYTSVSGIGSAGGTVGGFLRLLWFGPHDVDRGGVKIRLDMRRIVFLDYLDAGAAVFGDLVDVRAFHQAQTNICVPQAVRGARPAVAIDAEIFLVQNGLEKFALPFRKNDICRFRQA